MTDREARIRARAHAIWQQEGQPHGRHDDHWQMASGEFDPEDQAMDADDVAQGGAPEDDVAPAGAGAVAALAATAGRG